MERIVYFEEVEVTLKLKTIVPYIIVGILGILLLNLIASNYYPTTTSGIGRLVPEELERQHLIGTLYCFLFGLLIEWRTLVGIVKRERKLHFSPLLIAGIIVLAISCIAPVDIMMRYGLFRPFPLNTKLSSFFLGPLSHSSIIQNILAVTAGIMMVKGITKRTPK